MFHNCRVIRVIDADTFTGMVDLDFGVSILVTVRLFGCDAWETTGCDKKRGIAAKKYVESLIGGAIVQMQAHKQDSFGRWLCDVLFRGEQMTDLLQAAGHLKV